MAKNRNLTSIKYTSRDYESIKNDLVEYARRYYPDTFRDFNDASFGAFMLDAVAYIGDILSFYLDYQANETFIDTASEYNNVIKMGKLMGYKNPSPASARGEIEIYILVPANSFGTAPDLDYIPILKRGTEAVATSGGVFTLTENVNFSNSKHEVVVARADPITGEPTHFAIKAKGQVLSGKNFLETMKIGNFQKFLRLELESTNITDIISVFDSEGHQYYEVDYLSQNVVHVPLINRTSDKEIAQSIMKTLYVPRRFIVEYERDSTFLQFGYGSDSELYSDSVSDPNKIILNLHGKEHITDKSFDPSNLIATDKFGIAPANTTLTVIYRKNTSADSFAGVGTVTKASKVLFDFKDPTSLDSVKVAAVIDSLDVNNENQIIGSPTKILMPELKQRIKDNFASQNRAVTRRDYMNLIYNMDSQFGLIKRCSVVQDHDSFKRNLNIYIVSQNSDGHLIKAGEKDGVLKQNLKTWLAQYKMINDTIDILDANIINIGVEFTIMALPNSNKFEVLERASANLRNALASDVLDIGEPMYITDVFRILNSTFGVVDTLDAKFVSKVGGDHSDYSINIADSLTSDGIALRIPEDSILEIKNPTSDIKGAVK